MGQLDKLIAKMRNNPLNWKRDDVERITNYYGFRKRLASGSHVTFEHPLLADILTIPAHKPIKPIYIKNLLKLIDEVKHEQ